MKRNPLNNPRTGANHYEKKITIYGLLLSCRANYYFNVGHSILFVDDNRTNVKIHQISPNPSPNLSVGLSQYFYAIGLYSDGSSQDIGNQVNWVSSNISVATINSSGSVKAVAVGTSDITATFSGITSPPVSLTVVPATSTKTVTPIIPP